MSVLFKIIVLIIITLIASFDYKPFLSILLILFAFLIAKMFSSLDAKGLFRFIVPLSLISVGFITIITLSRYIGDETINIIGISAIGIRISLIGVFSNIFVKTTNPTELVLTLNKYFKMPIKWSYGFLSAYRFLPNFKSELETIKFAHQVRGIEDGRNPIKKVINSRRYIIPIMTTAIRKGIRVSIAMETKGFGKYEERTTFKNIKVYKKDIYGLILFILIVSIFAIVLSRLDLTQFNFRYEDF